jgi:hypothetical protein
MRGRRRRRYRIKEREYMVGNRWEKEGDEEEVTPWCGVMCVIWSGVWEKRDTSRCETD